MNHKEGPSILLLWHNPCPIHLGLGLHPGQFRGSFQHSSIVYLEQDITDRCTISSLTSCQMLPQGKNLQDVLPRDTYCRLKRHLDAHDALVDDRRSVWQGSLCRLPFQCHHWKLGVQEARLGHAHGQLPDQSGH